MKKRKRIAPIYKIVKGKKVPLCDYEGKCKNKAYREVYRFLLKNHNNKGGIISAKNILNRNKRNLEGI